MSKFGLCLIPLIFLVSFSGFGQSIISGSISDQNNQSLSGATVTASRDSSSAILSYAITESDGRFSLKVQSKLDSVVLKISYIGYKDWTQQIANTDQKLEVSLATSSEKLKDVVVESKIIEKKGDTLSYSVSAFTGQKDRVIGDVLKKMPGIEVSPDGMIKYQGKAIEKYYIEGLDLLEGRYNLANNNLAAKAVSKVQVLENHQPVKLLDSLEFSGRASLNIKLKKEVTLSGSAELGAGFSPLLWKAKLTPMLFTKKNQAVVTYQANNTGSDVSSELNDFSISDFGRERVDITKKDWLSIRQLSEPPFSSERWLDNNVHLGSVNYLTVFENDYQLKTNISYLNDAQQQVGSTQTRLFTPGDTVDILERTYNDLYVSLLKGQFILEKNTDDTYFKNKLEVNGYWNTQRGMINREEGQIGQELDNPFFSLRNKLRWLKPVGKQMVTFRSNTGYTRADQQLRVHPGQFENVLNNGDAYQTTGQAVQATTFFSDNSAGFKKKIMGISVSPEIGVSIKNQNLNSQLSLVNEDETETLNGDFTNNLDFFNSRIYVKSAFFYKKNNWSLRLTTPVNFRSFDLDDAPLGESQNFNRVTFEPNLFVKNEFARFWETRVTAHFNNDFGDINRLYYGFLLTDYRNLQRYNSPLPENFNQDYTWSLRYRNPLKSLFGHFTYTFSTTERNLIYSNQISSNAATILEAIKQENYSNSHRFNLNGSKYFGDLNTTLDLGSSYSLVNREQLLNGELADVKNQILQFNTGLESEIFDWLSASYTGRFSFLQTGFTDRDFNTLKTQQHELDLFVYLAGDQYLSVNSEYYVNNASDENRKTFFLNLNYQYTFKDTGIDLEASWNNVLNTDAFVRVSNSDYAYISSTYRLRPSQFLLSLKFTL